MNIKFKQLRATNFLSLGSVQVNLHDQGFVMIEGMNKDPDDNAKSNGAGKSSIAEAITFALVGETIRGTKDIVRKGCDEGCCVELDFQVNENDYTITRFKEHIKFGNQIKVYKNSEEISGKGIRDTEDVLKGEFPDLTKDLVGGVIILGQGLPQRFTNNTPAERKAILERLSKSDYMIEDIKARLGSRKNELQSTLRVMEDLILGNEREFKLKNQDLENITQTLSNLTGLEEITERYNKLSLENKELLSNLTDKNNEVAELNLELSKLTEDILTLSETLAKQKDLEINEVREQLKPLWAKKSVSESRIDQLKREIQRAKDIKDTCPTCGQKLQGVICIDTTAMEKELEELKSNLESIKTQTLKTDENIKQIELLYLDKQDIKTLREKQKDKQQRLSVKQQEQRSLSTSQSFKQLELNKVEVELNSYNSELIRLTQNKKTLENNIDTLEKDIKQEKSEKDIIQIRLDIIQKLSTTAQREFRTYLLESIIVYIDKRVKYYSNQLFNSEADFKQEGNIIYIGVNGKQYEGLSGGEKQKIDICVQFALRDMLVDVLGFNSNILFIDELFDNLDQIGTDSLINLITRELNTIESVFIITHHSDTMVPYDRKIVLCKDESGITKLLGE